MKPLAIILLFSTSVICFPAMGHDLADVSNPEQLNSGLQWSLERLKYMPIDRVAIGAKPTLGHPGLEYVIVLPNRWAQMQKINVCFVGGSNELRARILNVADGWFAHVNLVLVKGGPNGQTCQHNDKSEVRIGFSEPGYWSYIGNDGTASNLVDHNLTSMNFQGFDQNPPAEPRFSGIVLHELGHALGLHHEHQSPAGGCDAEYDWEKLYAYYKANFQWDQNKVDANVRQLLADRSAYDWSQVDSNSIMIYASNPSFLKHGMQSSCYFHDNNSLSVLDMQGIEVTYPKQNASSALVFQSKTLPIVLDIPMSKEVHDALKVQNTLTQRQLKLNTE